MSHSSTSKYRVDDSEAQWLYVLANDLAYLRSIIDSSATIGRDESRILTDIIYEIDLAIDRWVATHIKPSEDMNHDQALSNLKPVTLLALYAKLDKLARLLKIFATSIKPLTAEDSTVLGRLYNTPHRALRLVDERIQNKFCNIR